MNIPRIFIRGLKRIFKDRNESLSDWSSSNAGDNGRGIGCIVRTSDDGIELKEMLLFAERRLGVFGNSLKRLSRYAGLFPLVEGRAIAIAIQGLWSSCLLVIVN